ncbi:MAG: acyltransferase [Rhizobiaceae bacterium]|nr:acyltransferase [Rhizobiaceae bacterium]
MTHFDTGMRSISKQPAVRAKLRFETLDSWRGICAVIVAMMHFPASGWLSETSVVRGGYLFVDYFFVLSGAVIAHGYGDKIVDGASYVRFMALRLGRIYPLHVAVLLLFVGFEALRWAVPALQGDGALPFTDGNDLGGLVSSLLLLNGVGIEDQLVWNGPSWSISSEFWTYVLFGAVVMILRDRVWIALVSAVLVGPIVLTLGTTSEYMDTTFAYGLVRCIYGFSLGALIYGLVRGRIAASRAAAGQAVIVWTLAEIAMIVAVGAFVSFAAHNSWSFAAPFVFGLALVVFMHEGGLVSRLLRMRPLLWLGALSYGVYMVHIFVQSRMINVATLAEKVTGLDIVGPFEMVGQQFYGFGMNGPVFGTAMMLAMIVAVVIVAWIGNVIVERPFQRLAKAWVARLGDQDRARPTAEGVNTAGHNAAISPST